MNTTDSTMRSIYERLCSSTWFIKHELRFVPLACMLRGNPCLQSALLQKGVPCETRQLPLGDMLWIAKREDDPASEVLLGYIVERKTASDLASSIIDGR